jgi:2-dehydropantoate 2-reductase
MHVAIVGAGALGSVYGVRLARVLGAGGVTFVDREERVATARPIRIERIDHDDVHVLERPVRAASVPAHADVSIVCVRYDQLDGARATLAVGPDAPAVLMTPMLPRDREAMIATLGPRVIAAMPGVTAYASANETVRYWLPRSATTELDELRPMPQAATELAEALARAGIRTDIAMGVHEKAPATAIGFAPLAAAVLAAGGVEALLDDDALLDLALEAADEARDLARAVGEMASWANVLLKFTSKLTVKMGVALARSRAREAIAYADDRFARRGRDQTAAMMSAVVELAIEKGAAHDSLERLRDSVGAR